MLGIVNKKNCIDVLDTGRLFVKICSVFRMTLKPEQIVAVGSADGFYVTGRFFEFMRVSVCQAAQSPQMFLTASLKPSVPGALSLLTCFSGSLENISWLLCLPISLNHLGRIYKGSLS